jgi:recombination protein RecT
MVTNSLTNLKKKLGLTAYLTQDAVKDQINKVVGGKDGQQFITSIVSAVQANPQLQECTNTSILSSALLGQSLKLSPSPQLGHYYMMPFKNNKNNTTEAQFVMGYKGMIQLAIRSGYYKRLNVLAIKEGELVRYNPLDEDIEVNLIEDEEQREAAPTIGYYAMFEYTNGFKKAIYWSKKKMEAHALRYSAGYKAKKGYTFWEKDFDGMACKTMLRQLLSKWGAMDTNMQTAFEYDGSVVADDGTKTYVDVEEVEAPDPNATVKRAEEIINRAEEKIEAEKKSKKQKDEPEDAAAALFG